MPVPDSALLCSDDEKPACLPGSSWAARGVCEQEVVDAIEARQIVPYFQPKLCLKTKRILGVEVLARWEHPKSGLLPPAAFFQVIDECELYQELFRSLLTQGLKLQRYLYVNGESPTFSYNIEATQLLENDFAERLIEQVERAGIPLKRITLELTEKRQLSLDETSMGNIMRLTSCGVGFSLDDFGTGFSSISRLAQLPFNQIKLDAGFIARSFDFKESRIIQSVVGLARSLSLEVVAEGVETEKQSLHLEQLGVDCAQGYLFHKPMNGNALAKVLLGNAWPSVVVSR